MDVINTIMATYMYLTKIEKRLMYVERKFHLYLI